MTADRPEHNPPPRSESCLKAILARSKEPVWFVASPSRPFPLRSKEAAANIAPAPVTTSPRRSPLETHFRKGVGQTTENGCVLWAGIKDAKGRGIIYSSTHRRGKRVFSAHRVAWELAKGAIPEGQCVLHTCDNPPCINVEHLFLGTQLENIADMVIEDRSPNRKLTPAEVRSIRRRYAEGGVSQQQLADEYGVNQTTVSTIVLRKRYRLVN